MGDCVKFTILILILILIESIKKHNDIINILSTINGGIIMDKAHPRAHIFSWIKKLNDVIRVFLY